MNDEPLDQVYPQVNLTSLVAKEYVDSITLSGKCGKYVAVVMIKGNNHRLAGVGNNVLKAVEELNQNIISKRFILH